MKYVSTRGGDAVSLEQALLSGIAADGGLYVPQEMPLFSSHNFSGAATLADVGRIFLAPFFAGSSLAPELQEILAETFDFPIPITPLATPAGEAGLLELFHGPTAAFKDVGAGFLAACMSRLDAGGDKPLTILVATSGDTGGAVAAAFNERPGIRVAVLYPDGRVSARQAQQLTCWSENVLSLAVQGTFDDCQALVKEAMADRDLSEAHRFSSANSINIGRLLPQAIYYAHASLQHWFESGRKASFVVPTGNLGNALAAFIARLAGLPIDDIVIATNANRTIVDYLETADWLPRESIQTHASAMDVGNPSNMERVRALFGDAEILQELTRAVAVNDAAIEEEIRRTYADSGVIVCPHTATAIHVWRHMNEDQRKGKDWILVATAHPAKFETIVEPLIGTKVPLPPELARILALPSRFQRMQPELSALSDCLRNGYNAA
ncbi:MAG: threonine synthase [Gammaproteobacteria bacterium]|nr:threonine synthase [Gammaproteobacteria bacterium]